MSTYQTDEKEIKFNANVDRLFKLIKNVLNKGQYTIAEEYIKYLFETIVLYLKKKKVDAKESQFFHDFENEEKKPIEEKHYFEDNKLSNYSRGYIEEKISELISEQIKPNNHKIFSFIFDLLKGSVSVLFKEKDTLLNGANLMGEFKYISNQVFYLENSIPTYERDWFLSQTYNWFIDIYSNYSTINNTESLIIIENEIKQILRQYIDNDKVDLYREFLLSLSNRWFGFDFFDDDVMKKYRHSFENQIYYETINSIEGFLDKARQIQSNKNFNDLIKAFNEEVVKYNLGIIDNDTIKKEISQIMFNRFKLAYLQIILVNSICYSIFKKKYDFFKAYLNYHQPDDFDARSINPNYCIQSFNGIRLFLEDRNKLMTDSSFEFKSRHSITKYINTFLGYYLLKDGQEEEIRHYIDSITEAETIDLVFYNLENIHNNNALIDLPSKLILEKEKIDSKLQLITGWAETKQIEIRNIEIENLPIEKAAKDNFFNDFFKYFENFSLARRLFKQYGVIEEVRNHGTNFGIDNLFPRQAFIKQQNVMFVSSAHNQLASFVANDETIFIFSKIEKLCEKREFNKIDLENFIKENSNRFDLLISNTRSIKPNFPNLNFSEKWSLDNKLNKIPDFLGILNENLNVFLLDNNVSNRFMLLNSNKLGILKNCLPPDLNDPYSQTNKQFVYSFIDYSTNHELRAKQVEKGNNEDELKKQVWIRIFESIDYQKPDDFDGISIEVKS